MQELIDSVAAAAIAVGVAVGVVVITTGVVNTVLLGIRHDHTKIDRQEYNSGHYHRPVVNERGDIAAKGDTVESLDCVALMGVVSAVVTLHRYIYTKQTQREIDTVTESKLCSKSYFLHEPHIICTSTMYHKSG